LYRFLLQAFSLLYVRGKIDDCVVVNDVEVMHSLNDEWFENELRRFNFDISASYHVTTLDGLGKRWYHRFGLFNWEEKLLIVHCGKECCIARGSRVNFNADVDGLLLSSSNDMVAFRFDGQEEERVANRTATPKKSEEKEKIHFKETIIVKPEAVEEATIKTSSEDSYTQHKGFEENDIF
jgi:hypothetical protein